MKLHGDITINGTVYPAGADLPWTRIYPFFLFHMLIFGLSGFWMAYGPSPAPVAFLFLHGGFAISVYVVFYLVIFGRDEVKWMFINSGLGLFGIFSQIGWLVSLSGRDVHDYPWYAHVIPFLYFVLYTFLLRHLVLDLARVGDNAARKSRVEAGYIGFSVLVYVASWLAH